MCLKTMQNLLCYFACVIAFEDLIYVYGQGAQEMQEHGRSQYQLLQERGNLPHYGSCWKDAIRHVHEGCRSLSEETQAEIALHLTNCFLAMSGHDTYECVLDKKPNLRGICINSMSDRAFNVYTEFYTHTLNICWFLRGQIWHETIAENTWKVGKQLEDSAKNQEHILQNQKESIVLQERLIKYGNDLGETMEKFYQSSKDHQEILNLLSSSINNLQSWLLGEISWFDTLVFYLVACLLVIFFTSVPRTNSARLIMLLILTLNACIERQICYLLSRNFESDIRNININYYFYVWCSRYICMFMNATVLIFKAISYKNVTIFNAELLTNIYDKIVNMSNKMDSLESKCHCHSAENNNSCISESYKWPENNVNGYFKSIKLNIEKENHPNANINVINQGISPQREAFKKDVNNICNVFKENNSLRDLSSRRRLHTLRELPSSKYNLRSRGDTPDM